MEKSIELLNDCWGGVDIDPAVMYDDYWPDNTPFEIDEYGFREYRGEDCAVEDDDLDVWYQEFKFGEDYDREFRLNPDNADYFVDNYEDFQSLEEYYRDLNADPRLDYFSPDGWGYIWDDGYDGLEPCN